MYKISGLTVRQEFTYDVEDMLVSSRVIGTYVPTICTNEIFDCPKLSTICTNLIGNQISLRLGFHEIQ